MLQLFSEATSTLYWSPVTGQPRKDYLRKDFTTDSPKSLQEVSHDHFLPSAQRKILLNNEIENVERFSVFRCNEV